MLPKTKRLSSEGVVEVLKEGKSRRGEVLTVSFMAVEKPFRCAVVVSKKLARTAVMRNRVRRSVYRVLKEASLPPQGHAILFVRTIPKEDMDAVFAQDIKKLLYV